MFFFHFLWLFYFLSRIFLFYFIFLVFSYVPPSVFLNLLGKLFAAVAMSGSIVRPWSIRKDPGTGTKQLAAELGCPTQTSAALIGCLRGLTVEQILNGSRHVLETGGGVCHKPQYFFIIFVTRVDFVRSTKYTSTEPVYGNLTQTAHHSRNFRSLIDISKRNTQFLCQSPFYSDTMLRVLLESVEKREGKLSPLCRKF